MSDWTPGPWTISDFDETGGYDCMTGAFDVLADGKIIVVVDCANYGQGQCDYDSAEANEAKKQAEANARLIAKAPEREEQLQKATELLEDLVDIADPESVSGKACIRGIISEAEELLASLKGKPSEEKPDQLPNLP